jgi:hypothetical protein
MSFFFRDRQSGVSLIAAIVALGIAGIVMVVVSQLMTNGFKAQSSLELKGELEALRRNLVAGVDCTKTLPSTPASCDATAYIPLVRANGSTFVAANGASGTKVGSWSVRSKCTGSQLSVEVARLSADGSRFLKDPLTEKSGGWSPLFPTSLLCDAFFNGGTAYDIATLATFSIGPALVIEQRPTNLTSGTFTKTIGSVSYKAQGDRLEISSRLGVGARGEGRSASVRLQVKDGSTVVFSDETVHTIGGNACQSVAKGSSDNVLVAVTPGVTYSLALILVSYDSGSSNCPAGARPQAFSSGPVQLMVKDYKQK